jgi:hypothetical protein
VLDVRAAIVPNRDLAPEEQSELDDATLRDAFNLFDLTGNQSIDKSEFKVEKQLMSTAVAH